MGDINSGILTKDNRSILHKIICKLFHKDERFIDTCGSTAFHTVILGHKCFKDSILIRRVTIELIYE